MSVKRTIWIPYDALKKKGVKLTYKTESFLNELTNAKKMCNLYDSRLSLKNVGKLGNEEIIFLKFALKQEFLIGVS